MMIKVVLLFLLVMVLIAMVGNLLFPGALARRVKQKAKLTRPATCPRCGRYVIGKSGCDCSSKA